MAASLFFSRQLNCLMLSWWPVFSEQHLALKAYSVGKMPWHWPSHIQILVSSRKSYLYLMFLVRHQNLPGCSNQRELGVTNLPSLSSGNPLQSSCTFHVPIKQYYFKDSPNYKLTHCWNCCWCPSVLAPGCTELTLQRWPFLIVNGRREGRKGRGKERKEKGIFR